MEEKNKKKNIILLIITVFILLVLIAGATYAYFQAQAGNTITANLDTTTGTVDNLTFMKDKDISIDVTQDDFKYGGEDKEDITNLTATLIANDTTKTTEEYKYNIYLEIKENNFEYTSYETENEPMVFTKEYDKTLGNNVDYNGLTNGYEPIPEMFLTIKGPTEIEIPILKKATLQEENDSYDITELREGIYPLVEDYKIKVTADNHDLDKEDTKTDKWEIKITFKNLDTDQELNTNKTLNAKIRIQAEKIPTNLMDVCGEGENLADCIKKLHDKSEYGASNIIHHDGDPDYPEEINYNLEAEDNSYRYTGSFEKVNNYICIGDECSDDPKNPGYNNLYRIIGTFGEDGIKVVKADYANKDMLGSGTQETEDFENVDTSQYGSCWSCLDVGTTYGPTGNPKNDASEKDEFSHRYKGKLEQIDRYRWQENGTTSTVANWQTSLLNKIHLNNNYLNKIEEKYRNLITKHTWIYSNDSATYKNMAVGTNAKTVYDYELGNLKTNKKTDSENIGLLYVSDYLYGASPQKWDKKTYGGKWSYKTNSGKQDKYNIPIGIFDEGDINIDYRSATDSNWLYMGLREWLITQRSDPSFLTNAYYILGAGHTYCGYTVGYVAFGIRPSFYLSNDTQIKSGTGTISDPYKLLVTE